MIELTNYRITEYCELDKETGEMNFSRNKKINGFTGLYFKEENHFFWIYPTKDGPVAYFEGKEYKVHPDLDIQFIRNGQNRKFKIVDYSIEINYKEVERLGWDIFMFFEEDEVDLFCMIEQRYQDQDFYDQYSL